MDTKQESFFKYLRSIAISEAKFAIEGVRSGEDEVYKSLRKYLTDEEALSSFESAVRTACVRTIESFLTAVDGCAFLDGDLELVLADAETGESLVGEDQMYHDEFSFYMYEHDRKEQNL